MGSITFEWNPKKLGIPLNLGYKQGLPNVRAIISHYFTLFEFLTYKGPESESQ